MCGMTITWQPAALALRRPVGESSNATHCRGETESARAARALTREQDAGEAARNALIRGVLGEARVGAHPAVCRDAVLRVPKPDRRLDVEERHAPMRLADPFADNLDAVPCHDPIHPGIGTEGPVWSTEIGRE